MSPSPTSTSSDRPHAIAIPSSRTRRKAGRTKPDDPCGASLPCRVMVVADHPRNLPRPILVLPQMNELPLAHPFRIVVPGMVKAMHSHFKRAIPLHGLNLQRPGTDLACTFPAFVFLCAFRKSSRSRRQATLVVV